MKKTVRGFDIEFLGSGHYLISSEERGLRQVREIRREMGGWVLEKKYKDLLGPKTAKERFLKDHIMWYVTNEVKTVTVILDILLSFEVEHSKRRKDG